MSAPEDIFDMLASDPMFAVRYLYRICLVREVDPGAFANDVAFLNNGGTLNELMANIQDSVEGVAVINAQRKALDLPAQAAVPWMGMKSRGVRRRG